MIINPYFAPNSGGSVPTGNLRVWLKADTDVTYNISNQVAQWNTQTGNV